jgi:hypothetical protein
MGFVFPTEPKPYTACAYKFNFFIINSVIVFPSKKNE